MNKRLIYKASIILVVSVFCFLTNYKFAIIGYSANTTKLDELILNTKKKNLELTIASLEVVKNHVLVSNIDSLELAKISKACINLLNVQSRKYPIDYITSIFSFKDFDETKVEVSSLITEILSQNELFYKHMVNYSLSKGAKKEIFEKQILQNIIILNVKNNNIDCEIYFNYLTV